MPGYVGFWQRLLAFLIDWMLVFVAYGPLVVMAFGTEYFSLEVPRYWDAATGLVIAAGTLLFWRYQGATDRKSTRLNSSHVEISYAVFCLKKKKKNNNTDNKKSMFNIKE